MPWLLLRAASKSVCKAPRRVLRYVFGPASLPWGCGGSMPSEYAAMMLLKRSPSALTEGFMKLCFFLGLVMSVAGTAAEPSGAPVPQEVTAWIQSYASSQSSHGIAPTYYAGGTKIAEGRLSGKSAAAVVFTLEGAGGGNNYTQHLAVFWKRHTRYEYCCSRLVGGKGIRSVEQVSLRSESIHIAGNNYVAGADPMCCPSKPYTEDLAVQNSQLIELRASDIGRTQT
jgi:hypothetical protein